MFRDLTQLDAEIAAAGLDITGLGRIEPLKLSQIQALLEPGEVRVTFLLPGL